MKNLRSGYTTGTCAAAAAKGAALLLLRQQPADSVSIALPNGTRVRFVLHACRLDHRPPMCAYASVIKDAGDDPDVTNGAEIGATVCRNDPGRQLVKGCVEIRGGEGVGIVTKPGLAVAVGEAAINPVPRQMIDAAVREAINETNSEEASLQVTITVPRGLELAAKTLNERLGIIGGISILGTTGIVRPISAEAWTATIATAMEVARAAGNLEVVLSTGRTSEAALQARKGFPEEAYIMMGDYLEFALQEAAKYPFVKLHISGMWAKIIKAALRIPQTHVRFGALEVVQATQLMQRLCPDTALDYLDGANTARELYERIVAHGDDQVIGMVCQRAREYHQQLSKKPVTVYLVSPQGKIVATVGEAS